MLVATLGMYVLVKKDDRKIEIIIKVKLIIKIRFSIKLTKDVKYMEREVRMKINQKNI